MSEQFTTTGGSHPVEKAAGRGRETGHALLYHRPQRSIGLTLPQAREIFIRFCSLRHPPLGKPAAMGAS